MSILKPNDYKALAWWAKERGLRPQLSTPPIMYFKDKEGNDVDPVNINSITPLYLAWREQEKKRNKKKKVAA